MIVESPRTYLLHLITPFFLSSDQYHQRLPRDFAPATSFDEARRRSIGRNPLDQLSRGTRRLTTMADVMVVDDRLSRRATREGSNDWRWPLLPIPAARTRKTHRSISDERPLTDTPALLRAAGRRPSSFAAAITCLARRRARRSRSTPASCLLTTTSSLAPTSPRRRARFLPSHGLRRRNVRQPRHPSGTSSAAASPS